MPEGSCCQPACIPFFSPTQYGLPLAGYFAGDAGKCLNPAFGGKIAGRGMFNVPLFSKNTGLLFHSYQTVKMVGRIQLPYLRRFA